MVEPEKIRAAHPECPACVIKRLWFDVLRFCGCGRQGAVLGSFRAVMENLAERSEIARRSGGAVADYLEKCRAGDAFFAGHDGWRYLVYYTLDAAGLTEHGSSVPGWLTAEGDKVLAALRGKSDGELADYLNHEEMDHLND